MLAHFVRSNISRTSEPRYRYEVILKQGTTDYCLNLEGAKELLACLKSSIESAEQMKFMDEEENGKKEIIK